MKRISQRYSSSSIKGNPGLNNPHFPFDLADTTGHSTPPEHYGVFRRRRPIRLARARSSVGDGGATGALKNLAWAANAAIQRAPSRLYRLHDQPSSTPSLSSSAAAAAFHPRKSQSFRDLKVSIEREDEPAICPVTCCGPEFIVKSSLPPYVVILPHQPKKVDNFNLTAICMRTKCHFEF